MKDTNPIDDFKAKWDQEWYYKPVDWPGHPFVNTPALRDWMHQRHDERMRTNFERILSNIKDRNLQENVLFPRPSETDWTEEGAGCTLVLASLIQLEGSPCHYLYDFKRHKINDDCLKSPEDLMDRLENVRPFLKDNERKTPVAIQRVIDDFSERAKMFNPVVFDFDPSRLPIPRDTAEHYPETSVLPYCVRDEIGSQGATSKVYDILVPRELVSQRMRSHLPPPFEWRQSEIHTPTQVYSFVVKTYGTSKKNQKDYERECEAFRGLQNGVKDANDRRVSSMVRFFSCFKHTTVGEDGERETTHSILLESGWKNLMEIYQNLPPPQHTLEIIRSWERVINIAEALSIMNTFKWLSDTGGDSQVTYHGCHGDIKPDNILIFGEKGDGDTDFADSGRGPKPYKLKLGDFGFAAFYITESQGSGEPKMRMPGYTSTYGAPELFRSKTVTQAIDLWSFGCVLYIHATWIVKGSDDIQTFAKLRAAGTCSDNLADAFHNGERVLEEVQAWHTHLEDHLRGSDNITKNILKVASELLVACPEDRLKPTELRNRLRRIAAKARDEALRASSTIEGAAGNNLLWALAESEKQRRLPRSRKLIFKGKSRELKTVSPEDPGEHLYAAPRLNESSRCTSRLDDQRQERYQIPTETTSPGPLRIEAPSPPIRSPASHSSESLEGSARTESGNISSTSPTTAEPNNKSTVSLVTADADATAVDADSPLQFARQYERSIMSVIEDDVETSVEELSDLLRQHPYIAFRKGKGEDQMTPIMVAARQASGEKFEILLDHYESQEEVQKLSDTDSTGKTVLHHLSSAPTREGLARQLRRTAEYCPDIVNSEDKRHTKPIYWALYHRNSLMEVLLEVGADLERGDFLTAVRQDDLREVEALCAKRMDKVGGWIQTAHDESLVSGSPQMQELLQRYSKLGKVAAPKKGKARGIFGRFK